MKYAKIIPNYLLVLFGISGILAWGSVGYFAYTSIERNKENFEVYRMIMTQKSCKRIILQHILKERKPIAYGWKPKTRICNASSLRLYVPKIKRNIAAIYHCLIKIIFFFNKS